MSNGNTVARRIGYLRKRDAQITGFTEFQIGMNARRSLRGDTADMANFVKDRTLLCQKQQQSQT